ncbi:MAG: DUF2586 domain-containing protein [Hungatella sp.]|nr:DUF2586 domain-containing protein [Dorea sp.]MCI9636211.1 DUF2586 domain-containing protein [Hungatella sp.]
MRDINLKVEDGNLGIANATGIGTQIKIGLSNTQSKEPILITSSMSADKIKLKLGNTPLADACIDSVENGAEIIYCIGVKESEAGGVSDAEANAEGKGLFRASGKPHNDYDIVVEITETGDCNEACYRYSIDAGNTFSEEYTIPVDGQAELPETGVSLIFTDDAAGESFKEGDTYIFSTKGPAMSNSGILDAVEKLKHLNLEFEFVHIVGTTTKALWAALAVEAKDFLEVYKRPLFFVCEARRPNEDEPIKEYVAALEEARKGIGSMYLQVVSARGRYVRMDKREQDINLAGIVTGLYCKAKESQSIGEVRSFRISEDKLLRLLPEGIEEFTDRLDESKYLTFRQYVGHSGYFVYNARMMSADGSDFRYAEDTRVMNRIVNEVRKKTINELQAEIDPGAVDVSIAVIQARLQAPIEEAVRDKVISSGYMTIDTENLNILVDETLNVRVAYVPMGHIKEINITFGLVNPYAG